MSQETSQTKTIGDKEFEMFMMSPIPSNDLMIDALTMVGPSMGPVFDVITGAMKADGLEAFLEEELPEGFFERVAQRLCQDIDKKVLNRIIDAFRNVTTVSGVLLDKKETFDNVFTGNIDDMYRWIVWGVSVQWGKSLSALMSGASGALKNARKSKSQEE